ncbi:hypothetical protein [Amycolatopsis benzoatilytica]|uniref:hypothetical protein n=1 Tax=Amycolatopsis benzoatilytica TaxID=346045 RepID=UPI000365C4EE|nr:hypothetical protein [Amycolatopsis benzoatilytica]
MKNASGKVAVLAAAIAAAATVSACGVDDSLKETSNGHVKEVSYDTGKAGKDDAAARLPSWVPDDAHSVKEVIRTTGSERLLRYQAGGADLPGACQPGPAETKPPTLTASWWPNAEHQRMNKVCDGWHVAVETDGVFAYRAETVANADK